MHEQHANVPIAEAPAPEVIVTSNLTQHAQPRSVPATRISRLAHFSALGAQLVLGAASEAGRRIVSPTLTNAPSVFATEKNVSRLVSTLSRVRGAALKIGQMISIQDNAFVPPEIIAAFERVRQSADYMPSVQMERVMAHELGADWRARIVEFDEVPFAAASIGQVHRARLATGEVVAIKVQYPGVSESINSDIDNLWTLLTLSNMVPKGFFFDRMLHNMRVEMQWECDYVSLALSALSTCLMHHHPYTCTQLREAESSKRFKQFLAPYKQFHVPHVYDDLTTRK